MTLDGMNIIALVTTVQLLILTVVTFNYRNGKRLSNRLLSGFMASNALLIGNFLLMRVGWYSMSSHTVLSTIGNSSYLLLMPFLYLYIQSLCYRNFRLRLVHLLHGVPFVFTVLFSLYAYLSAADTAAGADLLRQELLSMEGWVRRSVLHLQVASYLIASARMLAAYRKQLKEMYSTIDKIDLAWCNLLLVAFAAMWLLDLLPWALGPFLPGAGSLFHAMLIISLLINLTFTLAASYKAMIRSEGFSGVQLRPKYAASRLTLSDCHAIVQKLIATMKEDKPYFSPTISLEELARNLSIPPRHISQALHSCMNQSFYDLINAHRIEEAKDRVSDGRYRNQTLLAIAYDVGFNSKSVFNAAFKKHTGLTPKEFRRRAEKSSPEIANTVQTQNSSPISPL